MNEVNYMFFLYNFGVNRLGVTVSHSSYVILLSVAVGPRVNFVATVSFLCCGRFPQRLQQICEIQEEISLILSLKIGKKGKSKILFARENNDFSDLAQTKRKMSLYFKLVCLGSTNNFLLETSDCKGPFLAVLIGGLI
jgi:hypothetical protein